MSGYKRVNFYELCRLCATNQQKEKTHIFQEEGRKIQLQNKIQSCLSLTVCENDFLPKVVCSKCLRSLEVCYSFRQECVTSESMLSSYFKNFRHTEDFKRSGKVYIKDISPKIQPSQPPEQVNNVAPVTSVVNTNSLESVPFYTLQLPAIMTQPVENKIVKSNPQNGGQGYNLNATINLTGAIKNTLPKINEGLSNVVVNANGEVLNFAQLVDFEQIINQAGLQKVKVNNNVNSNSNKNVIKRVIKDVEPIIKIDLCNDIDNDFDIQKNNLNRSSQVVNNINKSGYQFVKIDDHNHVSTAPQNSNKLANQSVIFNNNHVSDFNQSQQTNFNAFNSQVICAEQSTVNLNVLNQTSNFAPIIQNQKPDDVTSPVNINNLNKQHICEICSKSFKRREHLYQHVKLHTGFRPYVCDTCHKSFMRKEHLFRHMTSHSGQKNYTCSVCEKSFSRNDNLLKHRKIHEKQERYVCDICDKQFVMKHYFMAHKMTHEGDRPCGNAWGVLKA